MAGELPSTPVKQEAPKPAPTMADLGASVGGRMAEVRGEAEAALGEKIDLDDLKGNFDKLGKTIDRLADAFGNAWDKLCAIFAPLGLKPSEISASLRRPGIASEDTKEPEPEDWNKKAEWPDFKRAEHAAVELYKKPEWKAKIDAASEKYHVSSSTMIAFIEMESGFNSTARPQINPDTGKPWSSAKGLAQAIDDSISEYRRKTGNQNADLSDPATAIDFIGWHITDSIAKVNATIDRNGAASGFPAEYKLTTESDMKYLYMTYNNGPDGYLVLRRYMDNPTQENFNGLTWFQKRTQGKKQDGSVLYEWETRSNYAARVAEVARIYDTMNTGVDKYTSFDSPPLANPARVSSPFGVRNHPIKGADMFHNGVDYPAAEGTPVLAVKDGTVTTVVPNGKGDSGNYIIVTHVDGSMSEYLHLSRVSVKTGQQVSAGAEIGGVGNTGTSTGPHLHFMFKGPDGIPRNAEKAVALALDRKKGLPVA